MVEFHSAKQSLEEFGLTVSLSGNWLGGALTKRGHLFQGPSFAIEYIDGEWEVILGGHMAKWGRQIYFNDLSDAVAFIKKVYQELPEEIAMGWKPNLA